MNLVTASLKVDAMFGTLNLYDGFASRMSIGKFRLGSTESKLGGAGLDELPVLHHGPCANPDERNGKVRGEAGSITYGQRGRSRRRWLREGATATRFPRQAHLYEEIVDIEVLGVSAIC